MEHWLKRLSGLLSYVAGIGLVLMMVQITVDVVARTVFGKPLPQTIEFVSFYYMLAVVFLPLAAVEFAGHHVSVGLLSACLGRAGRRVLQLIAMAAGCAYFALMAYETGITALESYAIGEYLMGAFALPTWPGRFFLPVGCGVYALVLLYRVVQVLGGKDIDAGHDAHPEHDAMTEGA